MEETLLKLGAEALKKAALNEEAKEYILNNPQIFTTLKRAVKRYIGGETLTETVAAIRTINAQGFSCTTDFMGESIRTEKDSIEATQEFVTLAQTINSKNLDSSISLDLSHIGMLVSLDLTMHNLGQICEAAQSANKEVIISMEGNDRTDTIIDVYKKGLQKYSNLGITLQAYLHRTKDDFKELINHEGSIRMVKGAYEVPSNLAMKRGMELDEVYLNYVDALFSKNHKCSIASHDEKIHSETLAISKHHHPTNYVLERLLGIRNNELEKYKELGHPCRIYVVYGKEWYLYLCNRLAEYPLNIFQALHDIAG